MLRLDRLIKPWKDAAAFGDHINLYGFWNETAFLTKSGDLGMVLRVTGVDDESLDYTEQAYAVNLLRRDYFACYGIAEGLRRLADEFPFEPEKQQKNTFIPFGAAA